MDRKRWIMYPQDPEASRALEMSWVFVLLAQLMINRGLLIGTVGWNIYTALRNWDPFQMLDMDRAVRRIERSFG